MLEDNIVSKSNELNLRAYKLTRLEQLVILSIVSMIEPTDEDFKEYTLSIKDFLELLDIEDKSKYNQLPKITKGLMQKVIEIKRPHGLLQVAWLCSVEYNNLDGSVLVQFAPKLKPYLLHLKNNFVSYKLRNVSKLTSKYSIRIYELLKQYEFKKIVNFNLDEFRLLIGLDEFEYPRYSNFKQRILLKSYKEINDKTDLSFQFEEIKTGRKVTSIKFFIEKNKKNISKSNIDAQQEIAATSIIEPIEQLEGQVKVDDILERYQNEECNFNEDFTYKELDPVKQVQKIFKSYKITEHEAKCILNDANNDIELIKECCNYIQDKDIKNVVGYIRSLVKNYIEPKKNIGKGTYKKNSFNDYEQRSYDFDKLERKLLGWDKE